MSDRTFADYGIEIPLGRYGEVDTTCPRCSGTRRKSRDRCLSVNTTKGTWLCMHCGWTGGLTGPGIQDFAPPKTYRRPDPLPEGALPPNVLAWFAGRGIPDWVLADHKISASPDGSVIHFPYFRDGELVNVKHRANPKRFWMETDAERVLYGVDRLVGAEQIVVVEGEMDALSVAAVAGGPCVSVPDGAPAPNTRDYAGKLGYLDGARMRFEAAKVVVLATDADAPGQALADELARRIGPEKCRRVAWPEGYKDANEVLVALGPRALVDLLAGAKPEPVAGIFTVDDLYDDLIALWEHGLDRGCELVWRDVRPLYRPRPGLVTILTGIPSHGKSAWLDNVLVCLARDHGWRCGICSPENQPLAAHLARIIQIKAGAPFHDGPTRRLDRTELDAWAEWANRHFAFVLPDEPSVESILDKARVLVYRMGITGLVIDPWNEVEHAVPKGVNETTYVGEALMQIRRFARNRRVHVWVVAHPTKLRKNDDGSYPVPTLYDVASSANFANKADYGLSVWRDPMRPEEPTQIHVQKIRFPETGQTGVACLRYDRATGRFGEV